MKTIYKTLTSLTIGLIPFSYATDLTVTTEPAQPEGSITAEATQILKGDTPTLNWTANLPKKLEDYVDIETGEIKRKTLVKVYMIGTGVTSGSTLIKTETAVKLGESSWQTIHLGTQTTVTPDAVMATKTLESGEKIGMWSDLPDYRSKRYFRRYAYQHKEVVILKNGDEAPTNQIIDQDAREVTKTAEEFMRPYLVDGKLSLGVLDIMMAADLTHTYQQGLQGYSGYDLQDSIVLFRFFEPLSTKKSSTPPNQ